MNAVALSPEKVSELFEECRFRTGENTRTAILAEGTTIGVFFEPNRVARRRTEIEGLLKELPDKFRRSGGEGWLFSEANRDRNGRIWADNAEQVEQLVLLGLAAGKVQYCVSREDWKFLAKPKDPYFVVKV